MQQVFVTGGSGFLGSILVQNLLDQGCAVTSLDLVPSHLEHPRLRAVVGDIRHAETVAALMSAQRPQVVYHCAALLAHGSVRESDLWTSNVDGTRVVAEASIRAGVRQLVYTSSNCLWGMGFSRPVREDDAPAPAEVYGRSKWFGEQVLQDYADRLNSAILRCPTIMDEGRLGLLSILFEFISEGRRVWLVGDGSNRYQFIYAQDLVAAMTMAGGLGRSDLFGIGSDDVPTMRETYAYVIAQGGSASRVASLPKAPTIAALKLAHLARVSPLGPYHYRMIASDFAFDTSRLKSALNWRPTLTNGEMLLRAYRFYQANKADIYSRDVASAHRKPSSMGVIRALKWVS